MIRVWRANGWMVRAAACVIFSLGAVPAYADSLDSEIRSRIEHFNDSGSLRLDSAPIAAGELIIDFYREREFRPAWISQQNIEDLLNVIEESEVFGFNPEDFHQSNLVSILAKADFDQINNSARADLDILSTDALLRLAYMHYFGKVDPVALDDNWNLDRPLFRNEPVEVLNNTLDGERIIELIDRLRLKHPFYVDLISALTRYQIISRQGGWRQVPPGPALKPGMDDPRIPILRARLAATDDWKGPFSNSTTFDPALEKAVKSFQKRHGLDEDGIVGPSSLDALNVPAESRVQQIRVNLERARWVLRGLERDFVVVNIAGFRTYLVIDGEIAWEARSIVGRDYRQTPIFKDRIRYLEINPTWTVPPGILEKDIIPKVRENLIYLSENSFSLVDQDGARVDPQSVDWTNATGRGFPYYVVQSPGSHNALGLVKFMFPNKHLVYLHDTPSRGLFARSERTFSSGCVRVENPFDFAALLLTNNQGWNRDKIDQVVASGETTTLHLETPMPVLLLYWTAWADLEGFVSFRRDIYARDGRVLEALDDEFAPVPNGQ